MPLGYVIAQVNVTDPEAFEKYRIQVPAVTQSYGGQYLARGGRQSHLEGEGPIGNRTVLIRFESYQRAVDWYHSNEYAELIKLRQAGSDGTLIVVEGVD